MDTKKTTITGTVRVKYGEKLLCLVLKIINLPLKSRKESIFVSNKKVSYFDRFDSTSFYSSSSTWPDNGYCARFNYS